jgi:hypothetical protein
MKTGDDMKCEYDNVQHDCTGTAEWRIWADVTMEFHGACPAAVDLRRPSRAAPPVRARRAAARSPVPKSRLLQSGPPRTSAAVGQRRSG